jgi:hypothetical protein
VIVRPTHPIPQRRVVPLSKEAVMTEQSNAFDEGKLAAQSGSQLADNSYDPGSDDARQWEEGFNFVVEHDEDGEIPSDPA